MKIFLIKSLLVFLLTMAGLLCSLVAYSNYKNVSELKTWTKMEAAVVSTIVKEERRSKGTTYCPQINVGFELLGQQHTSKLQISEGPCSPLQQFAARTAETYSAGKTLEVYVNPLKPNEVRLATYSLGWVFYLTVVVGALSFVGVIVVILLRLTNRSTGRAQQQRASG
jgi:hypothetical protein